MPASRHRTPVDRKKRRESQQERDRDMVFIGLDGEGQGYFRKPVYDAAILAGKSPDEAHELAVDKDDHRYVFLAAATSDGTRKWWIANDQGLTTEQCLDFLINLPMRRTRIFGFALGYDWTKILTDLPNDILYRLLRPELRPRRGPEAVKGPVPLYWNGYVFNMQGTKVVISKGSKRHVIWDIFKFYGSKFVEALKAWKVGVKALWDRMTKMKNQRGDFDRLTKEEVRAYCFEECACMAQLAEKLVSAHRAVGLQLKSFYGAGSSAGAMLKVMGIQKKIVEVSDEMKHAVACGFFGGRFENSIIGAIREPVFNFDISSAYPYQLCFLPCLEHSRWEYTQREKDIHGEDVANALIAYGLGPSAGRHAWGPFPFRLDGKEKGSTCYPLESGGGWIWREEYLAGARLFSGVQFRGAWVCRRSCDCVPFRRIPDYYRERVRIGKEGPGLVLKLGTNSCYGKLAQSVGNALFNSWVWAGCITSGTRAQILGLLGQHRDSDNLLMIATDGVYTREDIKPPEPIFTGTLDLVDDEESYKKRLVKDPNCARTVHKPLGGWERKVAERGVFCARPGIYFPMNPTEEELADVRARGVGKMAVLKHHREIVDTWENRDRSAPLFGKGGTKVVLPAVSRFIGAKSSIHRKPVKDKPREFIYSRADGTQERPKDSNADHKMPAYGQWIQRPVDMTFYPMPKRAGVNPNGLTLTLRRLSQDVPSLPYDKALRSKETVEMQAAEQEQEEQPDLDFAEYI